MIELGNDPGIVLMISTLLDIEPSVQQEFAVPIFWPSDMAEHLVDVYFVQCSLSAVTAEEAVLDIQTNSLRNLGSVSQPSKQWEIKQVSQLTPNVTWQTMVCVKAHLEGLQKSNDPLLTCRLFRLWATKSVAGIYLRLDSLLTNPQLWMS